MLHNDAILMMLHCHEDFECVCMCVCVMLSIKMIQQLLPQTVDIGFVEKNVLALLPVKEQQSVSELAETITELFCAH